MSPLRNCVGGDKYATKQEMYENDNAVYDGNVGFDNWMFWENTKL